MQEGNGCNTFLWKYKASGEYVSQANSMASDRGDICHDLRHISKLIEELNKRIETHGQLVQMEIEEKKFKKELENAHDLYMRKMYHVLLFIAIIICVGLVWLFNV